MLLARIYPQGQHLKLLVIKMMTTGPPACNYPFMFLALGISVHALPTDLS